LLVGFNNNDISKQTILTIIGKLTKLDLNEYIGFTPHA